MLDVASGGKAYKSGVGLRGPPGGPMLPIVFSGNNATVLVLCKLLLQISTFSRRSKFSSQSGAFASDKRRVFFYLLLDLTALALRTVAYRTWRKLRV